MLRWLIVVVLAMLVFTSLRSWLEKFGFGRLPGDLRFRFAGRQWQLPLGSTVVLSLLAMAIGQLF
ncbi:DUF2905 domain-containing protein [Eleftheria terrae]|uniref:DUF2905 domain-containing protein n=1 Tax=Eleftheria terrae TaxID=1597781 RepID=UPI00263ABD88|nr:DUF2905 domain-containing protein [Eleftheria terrae]WKB50656.1 DUF2905 domain-containing protein [Eleftheria terrae]